MTGATAEDQAVNFSFRIGVRIDTLDEEMVAAMNKVGGYAFSFWLESGNDDTLSLILAEELQWSIISKEKPSVSLSWDSRGRASGSASCG